MSEEEFNKYFQYQVNVGWVLLTDNPSQLFYELALQGEKE